MKTIRIDLLIMLAAFAGVTLIALAVGATNLGTAMAFGQLAFAGALVYVMVKRD
ncbi:hypothetical protein DSM112329_01771 [Paraconexibacter sp. AEG42_29]|uniref:Uncharacterized protein n=1 Tax=Paraconexibacter sp. AEG42_29 TaxID=2997339 RepID=A0AAU7ATD8_9ACTN